MGSIEGVRTAAVADGFQDRPAVAAVDDAFARLAPRHRDCLRLVFGRKRTKEIAAILSLSPGTVSGYVAEAVRILGARDRIDAAERLAVFEALSTPPASVPTAPSGSHPESRGVSEPDQQADGREQEHGRIHWAALLPLRTEGAARNELTIFARIVWIVVLAIGISIAFGMLAISIRTVSNVLAGRPPG